MSYLSLSLTHSPSLSHTHALFIPSIVLDVPLYRSYRRQDRVDVSRSESDLVRFFFTSIPHVFPLLPVIHVPPTPHPLLLPQHDELRLFYSLSLPLGPCGTQTHTHTHTQLVHLRVVLGNWLRFLRVHNSVLENEHKAPPTTLSFLTLHSAYAEPPGGPSFPTSPPPCLRRVRALCLSHTHVRVCVRACAFFSGGQWGKESKA